MSKWDILNAKYKYQEKAPPFSLPFDKNGNIFDWQKFIDHEKLFWQYPVWTEKQFYLQAQNHSNYIGFPWATILDKRISNWNSESLIPKLQPKLNKGVSYITCCQHIRFRELKNACQRLNIKVLYTSHKRIGEDWLGNWGEIELRPCPLFAVNIEDKKRNKVFKNVNLLNYNRKYLYSFIGSYKPDCYISKIRGNIFNMSHGPEALIHRTEHWHFKEMVYNPKQNYNQELNEDEAHQQRREYYNKVLLNSRFSLCPSGTGPNSIRFWESLGAGSIPVLLSDTLQLPQHPDLNWGSAIIKIKESDFLKIPDILKNITKEEECARRETCLKLYDYFKQYYY